MGTEWCAYILNGLMVGCLSSSWGLQYAHLAVGMKSRGMLSFRSNPLPYNCPQPTAPNLPLQLEVSVSLLHVSPCASRAYTGSPFLSCALSSQPLCPCAPPHLFFSCLLTQSLLCSLSHNGVRSDLWIAVDTMADKRKKSRELEGGNIRNMNEISKKSGVKEVQS